MLEAKPHLFISHATWRANKSKRTVKIRQRLFEILSGEWDVFVDKERLKPGVKWRPEILHRLSHTQAGIILFDRTAIEESEWVKAEALIMCFRKSINPDFQLIPVLLDDLKPENEEFNIYKPFQLGEITFQYDDCTKTTDEISAEIKKHLNADIAKTTKSFRGWMYAFEGLLLRMDQSTLVEAWKTLIDEDSGTVGNQNFNVDELRRAVVQLIHSSKTLETLPAIRELRRELIVKEQWETICKLIKAKWIENESVEIIFSSTRKPKDKVLLIYYTPEDVAKPRAFVDCLFLRLKYECPSSYSIKEISVSEAVGDGDDAIRAHIESEIINTLGSKSFSPESEKSRRLVRENLSNPEKLTFCYIPSKLAKFDVLRQLHINYPELVFLVQVDSDGEKNELEASGGKNLTPLLNDDKIFEFDTLDDELKNIFQ